MYIYDCVIGLEVINSRHLVPVAIKLQLNSHKLFSVLDTVETGNLLLSKTLPNCKPRPVNGSFTKYFYTMFCKPKMYCCFQMPHGSYYPYKMADVLQKFGKYTKNIQLKCTSPNFKWHTNKSEILFPSRIRHSSAF